MMIRNLFVGWLHAAFAGMLIVLTLAGFFIVPLDASLPIHWNLFGEPDRFAPAPVALLLAPGMAVFVVIILKVIDRMQSQDQREAGQYINRTVITAITGLAIVLQVVMLRTALGDDVDVVRTLALFFAVLFMVLGNALPKSRRNRFAGIRVASSLADDANWQATHRFAGRLYIAAGVALGAFALVVDNPVALLVAILAAAIAPGLAAAIYSRNWKP